MPREALAALYRESDVALLPSQWEGIGLTFLEAMASGLAVVTVEAPPMGDYVHDRWSGRKCHTIYRPPLKDVHVERARVDVRDLADTIMVLCADPEGTRAMGQNARWWAERRLDWERNAVFLLDAVDKVMGLEG